MNVRFGRWKMICQPAQDIALGRYGATPGPIDPVVLAQVEKQTGKKATTERPADLLEPGMKKYREQCAAKGLPAKDEIAVLFAMFPQQVEALFKATETKPAAAKETAPAPIHPAPAAAHPANGQGARTLYVTLGGKRHEVLVETLTS
jgi:pyruvate/oxaloacetate carboxyltransferase